VAIEDAYITSSGAFLPGPPIGNDEMEQVLGMVRGKPSRLRQRILKSNGIKTRHYALNRNQESTFQNSELAARAALNCLESSAVEADDIDFLAIGSTQGDLPLPGMASMVQAELNIPACEIITTHGVCSCSMMALKSAYTQVKLGEKRNALVCASELCSRLLKKSRYEAADVDALDFEAEFLRWMLSDGAGAVLVQPTPKRGLNLRIEWIEILSYASDFYLCISCGTTDQRSWTREPESMSLYAPALMAGTVSGARSPKTLSQTMRTARSWQDYDTYALAEANGALLIRQNLRILDNIVKVGVESFLGLIKRGKISPKEIDHLVCHYSSHHFRGKILALLELSGSMVPEDRWFTNLYTKGNTGCASIFIALDELLRSGNLKPGQTVLCMVPESGRFVTAFMRLTVVEGK
jgi:3-oxoacyl-[acyl-carrier-protein] synthase-3